MLSSKSTSITILLLLFIFAVAAADPPVLFKPTYTNDTTVYLDSVAEPLATRAILATDKKAYAVGDKVYMRLLLINPSNSPKSLYWPDGCGGYFTISHHKRYLWDSKGGRLCTMLLVPFKLAAGDTMVFRANYSIEDKPGVPVGEHTVDFSLGRVALPFRVVSRAGDWLSIGHVGVFAYTIVPPVPYALYSESGSGPRGNRSILYHLAAAPAIDLGSFVDKQVKIRGARISQSNGPITVSAIQKAREERFLVTYFQDNPSLPPKNSTENFLSITENGRVQYGEYAVPFPGNGNAVGEMIVPEVDTVVDLVKLNEVINYFNSNRYWSLDSAYNSLKILGAPTYRLYCDGKSVRSYAGEAVRPIVDSLDAFIKALKGQTGIADDVGWDLREGIADGLVFHGLSSSFQPGASIRFSLPRASDVQLGIYNVSGQLLRTLSSGMMTSGMQALEWNGRDHCGNRVAPGVYLVRLVAGKQGSAKRIFLRN